MSEGQDDSAEKSFEPTPEKLKKAREKGQVPKSNDLTTAGSYLGVVIVLTTAGGTSLAGFAGAMRGIIEHADGLSEAMFAGGSQTLIQEILTLGIVPLAPWFLVPAVIALLLLLAQQAVVVTPKNLAPKMSRISIMSNAKNKFGRSGLFEFFKSTVKLSIYSAILGMFLMRRKDAFLASASLTPQMVAREMAHHLSDLMISVLVVALALGIFDLIWQRAEHTRKNMMTRKEMTDEQKDAEGDPHLKQQRRQRGQDIALNTMLADVPDADVVIVNPTHYAVALAWDRGQSAPPRCVAKGVDEIAARIREVAQENGVPIHSDPPTARALHAGLEVGDIISPEHFAAVAAAIRFADEMRRKAAQR